MNILEVLELKIFRKLWIFGLTTIVPDNAKISEESEHNCKIYSTISSTEVLFPLHPPLSCPLHLLFVQERPLLVPGFKFSPIPLTFQGNFPILFLLFVAHAAADSACPLELIGPLLVCLVSFPIIRVTLQCCSHIPFPPLLPVVALLVPVLCPLAPTLPGVCGSGLPLDFQVIAGVTRVPRVTRVTA